MSLQDYPEKLRPYVFHGVQLSNSKESKGDCPFCQKEGHFYVKAETGQFRCVRCLAVGNVYTFLNKLHEMALERTQPEDYATIGRIRHLDPECIKEWKLAISPLTGEWLVPGYNPKGTLANLYKVVSADPAKPMDLSKVRVIATPTCKLQMFGVNLLTARHVNLDVTEGLWDGIALYSVYRNMKKVTKQTETEYVETQNTDEAMGVTHGVVGAPGCGSFSAEWLELLDGRRSRTLFDSDHPKKDANGQIMKQGGKMIKPGWDGQQRIITLLQESEFTPQSYSQMRWGPAGYDPNLKDGWDLRDQLKHSGKLGLLKILAARTERVKILKKAGSVSKEKLQVIEPLERSSFEQLCEDWRNSLHFTDELQDTLALMMATVVSTDLDGDQIWFRIIGPPGSGKSTLAEALAAAREYVTPKSVLTGFHSGYTGGADGQNAKDSSLIPEIRGKMVIIKDGDTLIQAPNRDKILSELRDMYDGVSRSHYRNRKSNDYEDLKMTFVLCGTDVLRTLNRTSLGERFLDCEIFGNGDTTPFLKSAMSNTYSKVIGSLRAKEVSSDDGISEDKELFLKRATCGLIKHYKSNLSSVTVPEMTDQAMQIIEAIGQFMSFMRAAVERDGHDMSFRPRPELATRLVSQFTKLSVCLAIVLGKESIDGEVIRLLRKVALDTIKGFRFEITTALYENVEGLAIKQLEISLRLPETTIRRVMQDMAEFDILTRTTRPNKSGQRGRDLHIWVLSEQIREFYRVAFDS